jgi:alkylation response protein AidB-like acyl-CoA dehydrogenase
VGGGGGAAAPPRPTKVEDAGDDDLGAVYHLEGVKRFITSADAQTHENTVHLVLARPEGAGPGTKGLSLFIVPKLHVDADGTLGERNGVRVSNLEKKMGIKGSATCELTLGQDGTPCVGYLAGDVHDGIRQMFMVIEYARMMVGTKAMATLSTGYLNALDYAKVRQQGADLTQAADKTAPKVEIVAHPDVRRILMEQKAHAEGMRALVMFTGWVQDQAMLVGGSAAAADVEEHDRWIAREDLLLPLVKGYCSEKAYELLALSLQTFGGSGYTQDEPIEQYLRDAGRVPLARQKRALFEVREAQVYAPGQFQEASGTRKVPLSAGGKLRPKLVTGPAGSTAKLLKNMDFFCNFKTPPASSQHFARTDIGK